MRVVYAHYGHLDCLRRLAVPMICLVSLALLSSCLVQTCAEAGEQPPASAREHLRAGIDLWEEGKYKEAREAFEAAIGADSGFTDAYRWFHDVRTGPLKESQDSVLREIDEGLKAHPRSAMWHYLRTRYEEDVDERTRLARRAIELEPANPWGHFALAHAMKQAGRPEDAEAGFQRALDLDPAHLHSRYSLGEMYCNEMGRFSEALAEFGKIMVTDPNYNSGWARYHFDRLLYRVMPMDSVAGRYRVLTASDDSALRWFAYMGLGDALRNMRQYQHAADAYRAAVRNDPRGRDWSRVYYYLGEVLYRAGDTPGAVAAYDSVIASGDSAAYYFSRAAKFRENLFDPALTRKARILDVPYESQFGLPTCAGTCVSMIMNYYADPIEADDVNAFIHNPLYGSAGHAENIVRYPIRRGYIADRSHAPMLGYVIDIMKGPGEDRLHEIRSMIDGSIPVEIGVHGGTHAILVVGYDDCKGAVIVHNSQWVPAKNVFAEIPYDEFLAEWSTAAYTRFMIVPPSRKEDIPSWKLKPLLSTYPNDYPGLFLGTQIPWAGEVPSLYRNSPDRYAAERDEAVSFGLSLDRFGTYQRLWLLTHNRYNDERWRFEAGFLNQGFPSGKLPARFHLFWEEDLYGGGIFFRPFLSLTFGIEAYQVESDGITVFGRQWERGTDVYLTARYVYGSLEGWLRNTGWMIGTEVSGAAEFLGSDYSYARGDIELVKAFPLPFSGGLQLRDRMFWTEGEAPLQAGYLPGVNVGFRNAGNTVTAGDRGVVLGAELRKRLLAATPVHPSVPLVCKIFYDASYAWSEDVSLDEIAFADFWKSWGIGLEYAFIHLDIAFPVEGRISGRSEFYLNVIGIDQVMLDTCGGR